MTAAEQLLTDLRTRGIGVRLDGDVIRCKAPDGIVPPDLAIRIRAIKPELAALLAATEEEIAWRVAQIGAELLQDVPDADAGICPWCWSPTPGRSGRCVLCCLAAATVAAQTKAAARPGDISPPGCAARSGADMSPATGMAA